MAGLPWTATAVLLTLAAAAPSLRGETVWWVGGTAGATTDWHTAGNWTNALGAAALPGPGTNVVIDVIHGGGTTNHPTLDLAGGAVTIGSLTLGSTPWRTVSRNAAVHTQ